MGLNRGILRALLAACRSETPRMLACLRRAVELESPSQSKAHVDRVANYFAREFRDAGGQVRLLPHLRAGAAVLAEFWPGRPKPLLLLGHTDTVYDVGTLGRMPFRLRGGRACGPGILDMKSGIVIALGAFRALRALKLAPPRPVRVFLNPDEEVSSRAFRRTILSEARRARAVLVLEPAAAGGALKTARKGVGEFRMTVRGRAAHAGINPGAGVNAIEELCRQILRVQSFARPAKGLTLNAGVIEGGSRSNVIPERASVSIDVRVPALRDKAAIERKVFGLKPVNKKARLEITGGINRPPMERKMAAGLFAMARELGRSLGMKLQEASTGGGSDGNFTAALGIPTLDGLGGVGDGAHSPAEFVVVSELPRRAALLAALIACL